MSENNLLSCENGIGVSERIHAVLTTSSVGLLSNSSSTTSIDSVTERSRQSSIDNSDEAMSARTPVFSNVNHREQIDEHDETIALPVTSMQPNSNSAGDTNHRHKCEKTSVNPFFNFLRLYRQLPVSQGKPVTRLSVEGGSIWRAMTPDEKQPFREVAVRESRRRRKQKQCYSKEFGRCVRRVAMKHRCLFYTVTQRVPAQ